MTIILSFLSVSEESPKSITKEEILHSVQDDRAKR